MLHLFYHNLKQQQQQKQQGQDEMIIFIGHVEGLLGYVAKFCILTWMVILRMLALEQITNLHICFIGFFFFWYVYFILKYEVF